jgi:hypothetical protein
MTGCRVIEPVDLKHLATYRSLLCDQSARSAAGTSGATSQSSPAVREHHVAVGHLIGSRPVSPPKVTARLRPVRLDADVEGRVQVPRPLRIAARSR